MDISTNIVYNYRCTTPFQRIWTHAEFKPTQILSDNARIKFSIHFLPSSRAYSRPRPFPAPVTKTTLPSKPFPAFFFEIKIKLLEGESRFFYENLWFFLRSDTLTNQEADSQWLIPRCMSHYSEEQIFVEKIENQTINQREIEMLYKIAIIKNWQICKILFIIILTSKHSFTNAKYDGFIQFSIQLSRRLHWWSW